MKHQPRSETDATDGRTATGRRRLQLVLGALVGLLCIVLAFRGVELDSLAAILRGTSWRWIAGAAVALLLVNLVKGLKLALLLKRWSLRSLHNLFCSQLVGVLADTVIPFRVQEIVKAYVAGKTERIPVSRVLGVEVLEKVLEALVLCSVLLLLSLLHEFPPPVGGRIRAAWLLAVLIGVCFSVAVVRFDLGETLLRRLHRSSLRITAMLERQLRILVSALKEATRRPWRIAGTVGLTVIEWLLLTTAAWAVAAGLGLTVTLAQLLGLLTANYAAFALPARSVGALGVYEAVAVTALTTVFGMPRDSALAWVLVFHAVMIGCAVLGGLMGLQMAGTHWSEVRARARTQVSVGPGKQGADHA